MERLTRHTPATAAVIGVLMESPDAIWGLQVVKATGLKTGTVYPILERLEDAGWITSEWDTDLTRKGPRRRYFKLDAAAVPYAQEYISSQQPKPVIGTGLQSGKFA
ncbi:PadR family transcriptional regulator [Glutamicibacter sp. NPDC087344]|uniref:PadR family transcriptional regulator n=1 Tax=Glutamicibacter sp. NPDC087344 TaxID=3363994 RepID=UPI00383046C5